MNPIQQGLSPTNEDDRYMFDMLGEVLPMLFYKQNAKLSIPVYLLSSNLDGLPQRLQQALHDERLRRRNLVLVLPVSCGLEVGHLVAFCSVHGHINVHQIFDGSVVDADVAQAHSSFHFVHLKMQC
jgi:hypothetical protein